MQALKFALPLARLVCRGLAALVFLVAMVPVTAYAQTCTQQAVNLAQASSDSGASYVVYPFAGGTLADNDANLSQSKLRVFENGTEIGPAHSTHASISAQGGGRFSHWSAINGSSESLRFSAWDNSNPKTNGRAYTYCVNGATSPSDSTPPTVSFTAPAAGATLSGSAVAVAASAADNVGVAGVQFKLDGANLGSEVKSPPFTLTWNTTGASNGSHTLSAVARDAAGNQATAVLSLAVNNAGGGTACTPVSLQFSSSNISSDGGYSYVIYPFSGGTTPDNDASLSQSKLRLFENGVEIGPAHSTHSSISALGSGRFSHWSAINGSSESLRFSTSNGTDPRSNGKGYAYCVGAGGTTGGGDSAAPAVSVTGPSNGATVSGGSVAVTATASDDVGVVGLQFKLDGSALGAELTSAPYATTWNSANAANGTHTITAVARDASGKSTTSTAVAVTVNNTAAAPPANCSAVAMALSAANTFSDGQYSYVVYPFRSAGAVPDNSSNPTQSSLRVFENNVEVGPAHSSHSAVNSLGAGRFSHWSGTDGSNESLRISATNNTDPRSNGKSYSYCVAGGAAAPVAPPPPPAGTPVAPSGAKTLLYGWINDSWLSDTISRWAGSGYQGFMIPGIVQWFTPAAELETHRSHFTNLNQRGAQYGITDNFFALTLTSQSYPDGYYLPAWQDSAGWNSILAANFTDIANFARTTGMKGIAIDTENYTNYHLWNVADPRFGGLSRASLKSLVYQRGQQLMQTLQAAYPGIQIILMQEGALWAVGHDSEYELWPDFYNGMVSSQPQPGIVIGAESSYPEDVLLSALQSDAGAVIRDRVSLVQNAMMSTAQNTAYWQQQGSIAVGMRPLGISYTNKSPRYSPQVFKAQYDAAKVGSAKYVWVYSHGAAWWQMTSSEVNTYSNNPWHYTADPADQMLPVDSNIQSYFNVVKGN